MSQETRSKIGHLNVIVNLSDEERERFWSFVNILGRIPEHLPDLGNCWEWTGGVWARGYGAFSFRNGQIKSHRLSYLTEVGVIPSETPFVLHKCDNRLCVRPSHLFLGDYEANSHDMCSKGRHKTASGEDHYSKHFPEKVARGFQLPHTKLSEDDVRAIRALAGKISQREIAEKFNVSVPLVCGIIRGRFRTSVK